MPRVTLRVITIFIALAYVIIFPIGAKAATSFDLATTSNFNLRFDGSAANDTLASYGLAAGDINNDGYDDLIVKGNTYTYLIYSSIYQNLTGSGNTIDLANPANYNVRFYNSTVGAGAVGRSIATGDIDGDTLPDLIIGAFNTDYNSRIDSGSAYVIYNSLLSTWTGTGRTIDLANAASYSLRFDGPNEDSWLGEAIKLGDIDNDGQSDIFIGASDAATNGEASGALYIIYSSYIPHYSSKEIDLNTGTNYNLRYDGSTDWIRFSYENPIHIADIDGDTRNDLILGEKNDKGTFVIYNTLLDASWVGHNVILGSAGTYNLLFNGAQSGEGIYTGDFDGDGSLDILTGVRGAAFNGGASGSLYVIYNATFSIHSGTDNVIDFTESENYDFRFDGDAGHQLTLGLSRAADMDKDGRADIIVPAVYTDNNGRTDSGSLYIVYGSLLSNYTTKGNNLIISEAANHSVRYDGAYATGKLGYRSIEIADLNGDAREDILVGERNANNNSRNASGSLYVIYNLPHTITTNSVTSPTKDIPVVFTGSAEAPNSVTNITGVQYSIDSSSPLGTWTDCTADDGNFDSKSEGYTCSVSDLTDGEHVVYFRLYDSNTFYTALNNYSIETITVDTTASTGELKINNDKSFTTSHDVTLTIDATDAVTDVVEMMLSDNSFFTDASWEPYVLTKEWGLPEGEGKKTVYIKFKDTLDNVSDVYSDSVFVDTKDPKVAKDSKEKYNFVINSSDKSPHGKTAKNTSNKKVKLYIDTEDATSGVDKMMVSNNKNFKNATWEEYDGTKTFKLSKGYGDKTVYLKLKDRAGNTSKIYTQEITLIPESVVFTVNSISWDNYKESYDIFYTEYITPVFRGISSTGSKITLTVNNKEVASTKANSGSGDWTIDSYAFSTGTYKVAFISDCTADGVTFILVVDPTKGLFPAALGGPAPIKDSITTRPQNTYVSTPTQLATPTIILTPTPSPTIPMKQQALDQPDRDKVDQASQNIFQKILNFFK